MKQLSFVLISLFILFCFPLEAQDRDTPLRGEGALAFLRRHNFLPDVNYLDEFVRINQGKFGIDNSLLLDVFYELPSKTENANQQTNRTRNQDPQVNNKERKTSELTNEEIEAIKNKISREESGNRETPAEVKPAYTETISTQPETRPTQPETQTAYRGSASLKKEPLFGKNYEEYQIEDQALAGARFFLVSGHGGPDPGATCFLNGKALHEDEYAYDITLRLARNLLSHGAAVQIITQDARDGIRDSEYLNNSDSETCMGEKIPASQEARLKQRCVKINNLSAEAKEKYQRAVFIHLDNRSYSEQTDIYFYHTNDIQSEQLAQTAQKTFQTQYDKYQTNRAFNGTASIRDLYVLRNTNPVSIYVEMGNIRNSYDQKRILISDNRQALAGWLTLSLIEDYKRN
jgi:N-acetylmuramoyl-L-alanine amidase